MNISTTLNSSDIFVIEAQTKKQNVKNKHILRKLIFLGYLLLGIINQVGYFLIITSSQQFVTKLGKESLVSLYPLALIICNSFCRILNSKYFINKSYYIRVILLSLYFSVGYISLFFIFQNANMKKKNSLNFWLTMIPTMIIGTGESIGEVTILGHISTIDRNYVSGWNMGGAIAGLSGSFMSLTFKRLKISLKNVYLFLSPISVLYLLIFMFVNFMGKKERKENNLKQKFNIIQKNKKKTIKINNNLNNVDNNNDDENTKNKTLNCTSFSEGIKLAKKNILNLFLINILQNIICYCFCERVTKFNFINSDGTIFESIQYETLLLFYEIGIVISSFLSFIIKQITCLEIFLYIQIINFVLWLFESLLGYISNQYICFFHLIIVGICCGSSYLGFLYQLFNSKKIPPRYHELCLNICELFYDQGVLVASIISIILDNTIFKINTS